MPVMDGREATRRLRADPDPALRDLPIAAMTADAFAEDVAACREAGMAAAATAAELGGRILALLQALPLLQELLDCFAGYLQ